MGCLGCLWQAVQHSPPRLFGEVIDSPVVLWLCAGRSHKDDIQAVATARGVRVLPIDIVRGGSGHDLRRPVVRQALRQLCEEILPAGRTPAVVAAHIASPCRSFSPLNAGLKLRTVEAPDGEKAPSDFATYIVAENAIIAECAYVARTLMQRGAPVTWENSPILGQDDVPWYWEDRKTCASLWHTTAFRELAAEHSVVRVTAAMCRFGSKYRKYFTVMAPARMKSTLAPLVGRWCPESGGRHAHHPPAHGFDSAGNSHAAAAGQYPRALNEFLLDALVLEGGSPAGIARTEHGRRHAPRQQGTAETGTCCGQAAPAAGAAVAVVDDSSANESELPSSSEDGFDSQDDGGDSTGDALPGACLRAADAATPLDLSGLSICQVKTDGTVTEPGGRVTDGPALDARVRASVEAARRVPVGFASYRNLRPASEEELWREPLPRLRELAIGLQPACSVAAHVEAGSTTGTADITRDRIQWEGLCDWRTLVVNAPAGDIALTDLVGDLNLQNWHSYLGRSQAAFDAIRQGRRHEPPGDYVLKRDVLPEWARPFVWDTGDASDCRPVTRSDKDTVFPGVRQVDREALRTAAEILSWNDVDPDIVDQICNGGMEMRSTAPLHITAMWHHAGVADHFEVADAVVRDERAQLWTTVSTSPMPYVPFTCSPRDVILQERSKLVDGQLVNYQKPRLSHNLSAVPRALGGRKLGVSNNSAVPKWEKHLPGLPTVASYGRAWAVCDMAAGRAAQAAPATQSTVPADPTTRSGVYGVDMEKAYCFVPVQRADRHTGCYLWPDEAGIVRVHVSWRMVFGGSPWPNRFERLSLLSCAWVLRAQSTFDDEQPPQAASVVAWVAKREALQQSGELPAGREQTRPAGIEPFLDDCSGRALCDTVVVPVRLRGRAVGANQTAAVGAHPAPANSRLAVHCALAIEALEQLGFSIPDEKTMCGSGMALLGALLDTVTRRVRCTEVKRKWVLHAVASMRDGLRADATVDLRLLERFTGRLTNLSQFFPELRHPLSVGYALSRVRWRAARGHSMRRASARQHIRPGGKRESQMLTLLDVAQAVAEDDEGVFLAPTRVFDATNADGVITVVSDASKAASDDGFGGYAFHPEALGVVFVMSCSWPPEVRTAMSWASLKKSDRVGVDAPHGAFSMPAGEAFASLALAEAVAAAVGSEARAVVAVGDCRPAASALSAIYSRSPQLRYLVGVARSVSTSWLGVAIPRELNVDADRLSHPSMALAVIREAEAAGARVVRVTPAPAMWAALATACLMPMGADPAPWEEE